MFPHPQAASLVPASVARLPTPEERAAELAAAERAITRELRRVYARALILCLLFMLAGLALVAWAVHSTDPNNAQLAFWGGLLFGNGGILITLVTTYHRAMEEGWL